jgi:hypothetical protein
MLCFFERLPVFDLFKSDISNLKSSLESISRQLRAWADALQNTKIKGQRYLNEKERKISKDKRERQEFLESLKEYQKSK